MLFMVGATGVAAVLGLALFRLPSFGHYPGPYGTRIAQTEVRDRHAASPVSAVVFDYRGVDTVGEEMILFASVMGLTVLLRAQRDEDDEMPADEDDVTGTRTSDAVRITCLALIPPTVLLGLYIVVNGHLSPGGGFQGGVVLGAAATLLYLAGRYNTFRELNPLSVMDFGEAMGAVGFIAIGCLAMLDGLPYLQNVLPLGVVRTVYSAGTIPIINLLVGLEVAVGVVFIVYEFLEQVLSIRGRP